MSNPDLRVHPPRSVRCRLGGFVHLPRLIDKARATAAGQAGEYHYDCPLDQVFWEFTGISADAFLAEVRTGASDTALLSFVRQAMKPVRQDWEVAAWSAHFLTEGPSSAGSHRRVADLLERAAPDRDDIQTLADRLDFDDYVTFGGRG